MRRPSEEPFSLFGFQSLIMGVTGVLILLTLLLVLDLVQRKTVDVNKEESPVDAEITSTGVLESELADLRRTLREEQQLLVEIASLSADSLQNERKQLLEQASRLCAELATLQQEVDQSKQQSQKLTRTAADNAESDMQSLDRRIEQIRRDLQKLRSRKQIVYNPAKDATKKAWLIDLSDTTINAIEPAQPAARVVFSTTTEANSVTEFLEWAGKLDPRSDYFVLLVRPKGVGRYRELYQQLNDRQYDIGIDLIDADTSIVDTNNFQGPQ